MGIPRTGSISARAASAVLALLVGFGAAARAETQPAATVIVLSWDGVRHDYPDREELPALARMQREGARAQGLVPVFPSLTFPNHVSLATGASVDRHGIVANRFCDRERGGCKDDGNDFDYSNDASWIEAEPIWIAAERQGVRSASYFWVGSETAWRGQRLSFPSRKFSSRVGEAAKVRQIIEWLDMPEEERPRLILSWWHGADHAGHRHGPEASETRALLREQDERLGALLAALDERQAWRHTTLLIVSDHGMTRILPGFDPRAPLANAGIAARVVSSTAFAHVFLDDPRDLERAHALFAGLRRVRVYRAAELPASLRYRHPTRTGDLVLLLEPPLAIGRERGGFERILDRLLGGFAKAQGGHGYLPEHPDMHGIFYALGRGIAAGRALPLQRSLDVAATIASLLGIEPPLHNEGRPIEGLAGPR